MALWKVQSPQRPHNKPCSSNQSRHLSILKLSQLNWFRSSNSSKRHSQHSTKASTLQHRSSQKAARKPSCHFLLLIRPTQQIRQKFPIVRSQVVSEICSRATRAADLTKCPYLQILTGHWVANRKVRHNHWSDSMAASHLAVFWPKKDFKLSRLMTGPSFWCRP